MTCSCTTSSSSNSINSTRSQPTGSGRWGVCEHLRQFLPHLSMGRRERSGRRGVALRISGTIQWDNPRCKDTQRDSGAQRERERERERDEVMIYAYFVQCRQHGTFVIIMSAIVLAG